MKLEDIKLPDHILTWGSNSNKEWRRDISAGEAVPYEELDTFTVVTPGLYPDQEVRANQPHKSQAGRLLDYITRMKNKAPVLFRDSRLNDNFSQLVKYFSEWNY